MRITMEQIRETFLNYFQNRDHLKIQNASVIPKNDPTLLFVNSGMAPLKDFFTGESLPPAPNICNVQPCIRTIDIDDVGDRHHLTSFEMLGSWSFNNYFKEDAIKLAYELLINQFKIPKDKLYVTIFEGSSEHGLARDDESARVWESLGISKDHIVPQPFEDNFWGPTAETGPCGPCTECFYDTGDEFGDAYVPGGPFDTKKRYIEIWNAGVFMEFNKTLEGNYDKLKFKSVDTGAGLERLVMTLNGKESVYETDMLLPLMESISAQTNNAIPEKGKRVISDHVKTLAFILSEGVQPSNEGRGYVARKLIRRCASVLLMHKIDKLDFKKLINMVIDEYKPYYPELDKNREQIIYQFEKELEIFSRTIKKGFRYLQKECSGSSFKLSGEQCVKLVTTHGLPIDFIEQFVKDNGGEIDKQDFNKKLQLHKEMSKKSKDGDKENSDVDALETIKDKVQSLEPTTFVGYESLQSRGKVLKILLNNDFVVQAKKGDQIAFITDCTSFYAQGGGQIADIGLFKSEDGTEISIEKVEKTKQGVFIHFGTVNNGTIKVDQEGTFEVDEQNRMQIEANHTATHLLQSAIRTVLGDSVKQKGSRVDAKILRFDFNYDQNVTKEQQEQIESLIRDYINQDLPRQVCNLSLEEAKEKGATAHFSEKYDNKSVRLVQFGEVSKELCGGTHAKSTGQIKKFKIVSISGIQRGVKRITAVTGIEAEKALINSRILTDKVQPKGSWESAERETNTLDNLDSGMVSVPI